MPKHDVRSRRCQDRLGYSCTNARQPFMLPAVEILMPTKKPRGEELTLEQHGAN